MTWKKTYKGPFNRPEAVQIASQLRERADVEINGIQKVSVRKRPNGKYDVWIKLSTSQIADRTL